MYYLAFDVGNALLVPDHADVISRIEYTYRLLFDFCVKRLRKGVLLWSNFDYYIDILERVNDDECKEHEDFYRYIRSLKEDGTFNEELFLPNVIYDIHERLRRNPYTKVWDDADTIIERRNRVYEYLTDFSESGCVIDENGEIKELSDGIDEDICDDIFILMADAISTYFHYDQYDKSEIRESLLICMMYLDSYFNAYTDIFLRLFNLLTNKHSEFISKGGKYYIMRSFIKDKSFVINISESTVWNITRETKELFERDWETLTLCYCGFEEYVTKLDAVKFAIYMFIYDHPNVTLEEIVDSSEFKEYLYKADSNSLLENTEQTKAVKNISKRISEINKDMVYKFGEAFIITRKKDNDKTVYYVPMSQNEWMK